MRRSVCGQNMQIRSSVDIKCADFVDYIEVKRRIVLVGCRLTLNIVAEQEYHQHCWEENVQICRIASSESCTFCMFEKIA